jgi:hypothetical protein
VAADAAAADATTGLVTTAGWASIDGLGGCGLGSAVCGGGRTVGGWFVAFVAAAAVADGVVVVFAALDALAVEVFSTGTAADDVEDEAGADISM